MREHLLPDKLTFGDASGVDRFCSSINRVLPSAGGEQCDVRRRFVWQTQLFECENLGYGALPHVSLGP